MVKPEKLEAVEKLSNKINNANTVMICNFNGLPSNLFHKTRKSLRGKAEIIVSKNSLIKRALEKTNLYLLNDDKYNTAIILSNLSPFEIYKLIKENVVFAPPKPNSIAPEDIVVKAGETSFAPGPMVAELQKYGIKAKIMRGKVIIESDSIVAKKGDKISVGLSTILGKLGITPVEQLLRPVVASDKKTIFSPEILDINVDKYRNKFLVCYQNALNLSVVKCIYNEKSIPIILQKAYLQTKNFAIQCAIPTKDTIKDLIIKSAIHANILNAAIKK